MKPTKKIIILTVIALITYSQQTSYCGSFLPRSEGTCDHYTNDTHICCYLAGNYKGAPSSMCYPIRREFYYTMERSIDVNGYNYKLDCGSRRGASCGKIVNPINYKDCGIFSTKSNSCCYYQYKNTTGCVWLGTPDVGIMKYKALQVICSDYYIKYQLYLIAFAIFMIL